MGEAVVSVVRVSMCDSTKFVKASPSLICPYKFLKDTKQATFALNTVVIVNRGRLYLNL